MKNFYKTILTAVLALFAMAANADVTTIYSWESPEGTVIETGGTIAYVNGVDDRLNYANGSYYTICLTGKKGNLSDTEASASAGHMVITLNNNVKAGDVISFTCYYNKGEEKAVSAYILFDDGKDVTSAKVSADIKTGATPEVINVTVPEGVDSKTVTLTRNDAGTNLFITKLVITSAGENPAATSFNIEDNGDGSVSVTPTPETASWGAFAYPEAGRASFLMNFGIDESKSDAEAMGTLIDFGLVSPKAGAGNFSFSNFMEMFGGAEAGNYIVAVAEIDAEGKVVGNATTKTIAYVPVDEEIEMNYAESDAYTSDVDMVFQNEEWYARFDVKEAPVVAGKAYTLNDLDLKYSYMKKKDAEKAQDWTKYDYQTVKFVMKENGNMDALVTVKDGEGKTMTISMYYEVNDQKSIKVSGTYEVIDGVVAVTAKNTAGDYKLLLNIKADDLQDFGMYAAKDITTVGNSIRTPWDKDDVKIVDVDIFAMKQGDNYNLMGTVTGEYLDAENNTKTRIYNINVTVSKKAAESLEYDLGALEVSEDEGDIKLKAQNDEHQFIGYITCATTDVPSGTYNLLSYSKYGDYNSTFNMYMNDGVEDGKVAVVNEAGVISITATFKQGGNNYTIKASTGSTGINNVETGAVKAVSKYLENGKIVILKNGKKYGVDAVEVK